MARDAIIRVRVAAPEDKDAVRAILVDSYPPLMAGAYEPALLAQVMPRIIRPHPRLLASGRYYLAEANGEAVGCGGWSFEQPGGDKIEPGRAHLRHFATRREWIGRGVGRALYDRCAAEAGAAGAGAFEVWSSLNGEPFYAALGFARIGRIDVEMGPGLTLPSIRMERAIAS